MTMSLYVKLRKCEFWSFIKEVPAFCKDVGLEGCDFMSDLYAAASSNLITEEFIKELLYDMCNANPDVRNLKSYTFND